MHTSDTCNDEIPIMIMSLASDHGPEERERVKSLCEQCPVSGCLLLFLLLGLVSYRKGKL